MIINNPVTGTVVPLEKVSDPVFSQKMMGDGIAIMPMNNTVIAPLSGTLTTVFPTKHAFGILGTNNEEVLIHIGIDTVNLKGEHFDLKVAQGQSIEAGDTLVIVDFEAITKAGYDITTSIVLLNTNEFQQITPLSIEGKHLDSGQPLLEVL